MTIKCTKSRCWSPVACGAFGYCRGLNFIRRLLPVVFIVGLALLVSTAKAQPGVDAVCTPRGKQMDCVDQRTRQTVLRCRYNDMLARWECRR